ncbi:MAG: hypothetical protein IT443_13305 [Phycisphaeraceae bacterium]|nr:hypothetical protein [Phycisphaeraceae bacterium]
MSTAHFHGPLRKSKINPRYFTDDRGQAIYLTGSHTWAVMQDIWIEGEKPIVSDYPGFLTMMTDCGHNFMRFWQWPQTRVAPWNDTPNTFSPQPYLRTGPGVASDGQLKFDLTKWNDAYFRRLRQRLEMAAEQGIYASIMLFEGWGIKCAKDHTDPWPFYPCHPANNVNGITDNPIIASGRAWDYFSLNCPQLLQVQKEFVRKIIQTVNDMDHILYEISNEVPFRQEAFDWMNHMADFVHEVEASLPKQHPVGITAEGGDQENDNLFTCPADWISPSNGPLLEYRYNPPVGDGRKVVVTDTDHLWGHGCETPWIWKSFTRGLNVLFMDPWIRIPGEMGYYQDGSVTRNQRYYYRYDEMRRNLGYARAFALKMDLNRCTPCGHLCTSTYCLADPGREYLCYFPSGGAEGLTLRGYAGKFQVQWFDPVTGKTHQGTIINGDQRHSLSAQFPGPSVLYLKRCE